jgi:glycolate oxidase
VVHACEQAGAVEVRRARNEDEAEVLWAARRAMSAALSNLGDKFGEDIAVPRAQIPKMINRIRQIGDKYDLRVPVFGHIGDGNLHPNLICDRSDPEMMARVRAAASEIFTAAINLGGTISGEHGIGLAKRDFIASGVDTGALAKMYNIKQVFDPNNILNPGKIFPPDYSHDI